MDFPDDAFDRVVAMYVASVVHGPERLVSEMMRVCRAGGETVGTTLPGLGLSRRLLPGTLCSGNGVPCRRSAVGERVRLQDLVADGYDKGSDNRESAAVPAAISGKRSAVPSRRMDWTPAGPRLNLNPPKGTGSGSRSCWLNTVRPPGV